MLQSRCWVIGTGNNRKIVHKMDDVKRYMRDGGGIAKTFDNIHDARVYQRTGLVQNSRFSSAGRTGSLPPSQRQVTRKVTRKRKRGEMLKKPIITTKDLSHIVWNAKQMEVINLALRGHSFFFTGSAGTGKSLLIEKLKQELCKKHGPDVVYVTATTGISSINVEGQTIHRWSGIGYERYFDQMLRRAKHRTDRWVSTKVLIIDEISMLNGDMFDNLEKIARTIRGSSGPFGGIQIILSGDFFQLPPVRGSLCFEAESWKDVIKNNVNLQQVYRQQNDKFVKILNMVRVGQVTREVIDTLKACMRPLRVNSGIEPTRLYSTNAEVTRINERRLEKLRTPLRQYQGLDFTIRGNPKASYRKSLLNSTQALETLKIKKGAQVILVKNLSETLVNGSRGYIERFVPSKERFAGGLSSLMNPAKRAGPKWKQMEDAYIEKFYKKKDQTHVPVVKFANGERRTIEPCCFRARIKNGEVTRVQIPLKCAWALTIHKCQGMSIDAVEISMENMFADGQFYVALSRVRSLGGLHLKNFDQKQIKASRKVMKFMSSTFRGFMWSDTGQSYTEKSRKFSLAPAKKKRKIDPSTQKKKKKVIIILDDDDEDEVDEDDVGDVVMVSRGKY